MRNRIARIISVIMALAMMVSILAATNVFAAKATFDAPKNPMTVDPNLITVACHSQAHVMPEVLGITNVTARQDQELAAGFAKNDADTKDTFCLKEAQGNAALGVFGSDINESPNPYLYNYFYNCYATENDKTLSPEFTYTLTKGVTQNPMAAATVKSYTQDGMQICASLYLRPDILIGITPVTGDKTGYDDSIAELPENNDEDKTNDYKPAQYLYYCDHVYSFIRDLNLMADTAHDILVSDSTRTVRYGDPQIIAGNVEKYYKGIQAYIIKQLNNTGAAKKTVALVDWNVTKANRNSGILNDDEYVINTKDYSTQSTTNFSRAAEFVADVSVNLADKIKLEQKEGTKAAQGSTGGNTMKFYVATADQIAENADVVVFADISTKTTEADAPDRLAFKDDFVEKASKKNTNKAQNMDIMISNFDPVGYIGTNSVENVFAAAYYCTYLYPEYINQFDVAAYWYKNMYHVSDMSKLKSVIATNFAMSSVLSGCTYTADISNFSEAEVEAKIVEGMNYYEDNKDEFANTLINVNGRTEENTGWDIDWERGIGAGLRGTGNIWVEQLADGNWYAVKNSKVTNEVDLAQNDYGWWYIDDNGQVDFSYTGLVQNEYGWWYVENGQVRFDYTGIKDNEYGWWRIEDGKVNFDFTGLAENEYGWWYLENGRVNFDYTGIKDNEYGWWRVENGQVIFDAEGVFENEYGWWYVTGGKVDFSYTGVAPNEYGWWRIENGGVNFNYTGIASNQYGTWYIKGGQVQFDYTGRITVGGTRYNVTNGKVG